MKRLLLAAFAAFLLAPRLTGAENLIENGEMRDGSPPIGFKLEDTPLAAVETFKGNPLPADKAFTGAACLKFTFRQPISNSKGFRLNQKIAVDPSKNWRFRAKVYVPDALDLLLAGRAHNLEFTGKQAIQVDGKPWVYQCAVKGPTDGWREVECLLPAAGSGEKGAMPAGLGWVDFGFAISAREPGVAYVGDLVMEPVK
jgi:hypothetical protein